jgi:hypothetical protein
LVGTASIWIGRKSGQLNSSLIIGYIGGLEWKYIATNGYFKYIFIYVQIQYKHAFPILFWCVWVFVGVSGCVCGCVVVCGCVGVCVCGCECGYMCGYECVGFFIKHAPLHPV